MKQISTGFLFTILKMASRTWISKGWDFDVENITWADNQTIYFTCAYLGTSQIFKTDLSGKGVIKGN